MPKIRPLEQGEFRENEDGSRSTEITIGTVIGGEKVVIPSLWMTPDGPVELDEENATRAAMEFEAETGKRFPRFKDWKKADSFARARSQKGGVFSGPLAR